MPMAKPDVGFGRPPRHSQFKPGSSGNLKGRPKRKAASLGEIATDVLNTPVEYGKGGRRKKATRHELMLKGLVTQALRGGVAAADKLLKLRTQSQSRDVGVQSVELKNWLPDYPGQTGEERSRQHVTDADFDAPRRRDPQNSNASEKKL
jgi:hypothetical protein